MLCNLLFHCSREENYSLCTFCNLSSLWKKLHFEIYFCQKWRLTMIGVHIVVFVNPQISLERHCRTWKNIIEFVSLNLLVFMVLICSVIMGFGTRLFRFLIIPPETGSSTVCPRSLVNFHLASNATQMTRLLGHALYRILLIYLLSNDMICLIRQHMPTK